MKLREPEERPELLWENSGRVTELKAGEAHVWAAHLDRSAAELDWCRSLLSAEERDRAGKFRFERDQDRYAAGRGMLRMLLGAYLGVGAGEVGFVYNGRGKPRLGAPKRSPELHFNLAHSGGLALYGLVWDRAVGVDIEWMRPISEMGDIARRFFSRRESEQLLALRGEDQREAFYCCWTRKEAVVKALGEGISDGLDRFDVSLMPGVPARLEASRLESLDAGRWAMRHLIPASGFRGALATEGPLAEVSCWSWGLPFRSWNY